MRMIDAEFLEQEISKWINCPGDGEYYCGYDNALTAVLDLIADAPTLTPPNEPLTLEQLREMKDKPAYLKVFDPLLESGWHIIKAVTEDKIIFRGWDTVYVPIDGMGIDYNLYRLAAYEDTGLGPEEIVEMKSRMEGLDK